MQLLLDFFPVIAFFVAYKATGNNIFVATGVIIVAVVLQVIIQWVRHRKVSTLALVSGGLVLVFGGLTLAVHDKAFIQWKVTVVNWLFAAAFLASRFIGEQPLVQRLMGEAFAVERSVWRRLNWAWVFFFAALGVVNLYVVRNFSEAAWVNFKLFGMFGLTFAFMLLQGLWLWSKIPEESKTADSNSSPR